MSLERKSTDPSSYSKKDHSELQVPALPNCDYCLFTGKHVLAYAFAKIPPPVAPPTATSGTQVWANLCLVHFSNYRCRLGEGLGQRFVVEGSDAISPIRRQFLKDRHEHHNKVHQQKLANSYTPPATNTYRQEQTRKDKLKRLAYRLHTVLYELQQDQKAGLVTIYYPAQELVDGGPPHESYKCPMLGKGELDDIIQGTEALLLTYNTDKCLWQVIDPSAGFVVCESVSSRQPVNYITGYMIATEKFNVEHDA